MSIKAVSSYRCFGCGESSPLAATQDAAEMAAYQAGWQIGHQDGQGHFACPECAPRLWDPLPLYPMNLDARKMDAEIGTRIANAKFC